MNSPDLAMMCLTAFTSVFTLLTVLALVMKLITALFPGKPALAPKSLAPGAGTLTDAALLAAITTTATAAYPGMKVTQIEEVR